MAEKQVRIKDEELNQIRQVRAKYEQIMFQLGQVDIQLHDAKKQVSALEKQRETLYSQYEETQQNEQNLFNNLQKTYGEGTINIDNGILTKEVADQPTPPTPETVENK